MLPGLDAAPLKREFKRLVLRSLPAFAAALLNSANATAARTALGAAQYADQDRVATVGGTADAITLALSPATTALDSGLKYWRATSDNATTTPTAATDGLGAKTIVKGDNIALAVGDIQGGMLMMSYYDSAYGKEVLLNPATGCVSGVNANAFRANVLQLPPVRQTVLSGPVDTNGLSNFGGSTGSTTVTASGTLVATASNGVSGDRIGSITDPSWTGLSTNGTMYLYLDIAADGTCTTGSTTLQPTYQWGGTRSITSGQATFNTQEMSMTVGNGSSAVQTHRVFVGQVTVAGGVVTAITWYGLMGRYTAPWVATLPAGGSGASFNHNLGVADTNALLELECTTADADYSVGDRITNINGNSGGVAIPITIATASMTSQFIFPATANALAQNKTTGANTNLTLASWKYRMRVQRSW